MSSNETRKRWNKVAQDLMLNSHIISVEYDTEGDEGSPLSITIENKATKTLTMLWVMSDDEGNGPGALHYNTCKIGGTPKSGILPQIR